MAQIRSEIAGSVWKIEVQSGQEVAVGQVLVILESMKMEIPLEAERAGRIGAILVVEGEAVKEGQPLLEIE